VKKIYYSGQGYLENVGRFALVENEVGGEEHEERELVALALESHPGNLEGEPDKYFL
jgi:hypothetical protein